MEPQVSRLKFLSAASLVSLAACAGGASNVLLSPSIAANPDARLHDLMRRFGVAAFSENGTSVVLPEYRENAFFSQKAGQCGLPMAGSRKADCTGGSGGYSMPIIATVSCTNPGGSGLVSISALDYGFTNVMGTDLQATYSGANSIVGPVYASTPPMPKNCLGETVTAVSAVAGTLTSVAQYIVANASKYASLAEWAGWALSGAIDLVEFGAVLVATLTAGDLLAILAAVAAAAGAVGAIFLYVKCEAGG